MRFQYKFLIVAGFLLETLSAVAATVYFPFPGYANNTLAISGNPNPAALNVAIPPVRCYQYCPSNTYNFCSNKVTTTYNGSSLDWILQSTTYLYCTPGLNHVVYNGNVSISPPPAWNLPPASVTITYLSEFGAPIIFVANLAPYNFASCIVPAGNQARFLECTTAASGLKKTK